MGWRAMASVVDLRDLFNVYLVTVHLSTVNRAISLRNLLDVDLVAVDQVIVDQATEPLISQAARVVP